MFHRFITYTANLAGNWRPPETGPQLIGECHFLPVFQPTHSVVWPQWAFFPSTMSPHTSVTSHLLSSLSGMPCLSFHVKFHWVLQVQFKKQDLCSASSDSHRGKSSFPSFLSSVYLFLSSSIWSLSTAFFKKLYLTATSRSPILVHGKLAVNVYCMNEYVNSNTTTLVNSISIN